MKIAASVCAAGAGLIVLSQPLRAQELPPAATPPIVTPKSHPPYHPHHRRHHTTHYQTRPLASQGTPVPNQADAAGMTAAPVPNEDIGPPRAPADTGASVNPGNLAIHYPPLGNGYLPGSSPQDMANTQMPRVPGVSVKVPLEQARPETLPPPDPQ